MEKLNKLDLQILKIVSRDARITIKDMAEECGSSRSAVNQRLQRLIMTGVIKHPGYLVEPESLGYNTCAYVGIRLEKGSMYNDVAEEISEIQEVVECHATTGRYTMIIKLFAYDNHDLMRILNQQIQPMKGVTDTETLISLDCSFNRGIKVPSVLITPENRSTK